MATPKSLETIVLDCELNGFSRAQVMQEFIYLNVFFERERPDSVLRGGPQTPKDKKKPGKCRQSTGNECESIKMN